MRAGESAAVEAKSRGVLATACDWEKTAQVSRVRPDIVLWSAGTKQVVVVEPTAPWEERTVELKKYQPLILESQQNGWKAWNLSVEVGCSGFAGLSLWKALGLLGINGLARKRLVVSITNQSEAASRWIWIQREVRWQGQQVSD